jgi:hypothetical protein
MSISLHIKLKELERKLEALENRILMLEMQKRPVEAVGFQIEKIVRPTISLRGKAA